MKTLSPKVECVPSDVLLHEVCIQGDAEELCLDLVQDVVLAYPDVYRSRGG